MSQHAATQTKRQNQATITSVSGVLQRNGVCGDHLRGSVCDKNSKKRQFLHRAIKSSWGEGCEFKGAIPNAVHDALLRPGQPLDSAIRGSIGTGFGHDFSEVRVHVDAKAGEAARAVNALAYTVGSHMFFGPGQYAPRTESGKRTLAHELAHVVEHRRQGFLRHISRQPAGSTPAPPPAKQALQAIASFRSRTSPQAFTGLNRNTVTDDLEKRVSNPALINQSGLPVCGVAAFAYVWASRNIVAYVRFAISLFEHGWGEIGGQVIEPDNDLKSKSPGSYAWQAGLRPAEADWLVLSSIRDSENAMIDFEGGPSEDIAGGTPEGEIIDWLRELGFSNVRDEVSRTFGKNVADARALNASVDPRNYIVLCVDASMIDPSMKKAGKGNHWVVLRSRFFFKGGNIEFRVWSWGAFYDIKVTEATFDATFYGAIIASDR